jgi:hypothetical protein
MGVQQHAQPVAKESKKERNGKDIAQVLSNSQIQKLNKCSYDSESKNFCTTMFWYFKSSPKKLSYSSLHCNDMHSVWFPLV